MDTEQSSSADTSGVEKERQLLASARAKGRLATLGAYMKLSGPGWLQSAITLGGGSLAGSLYLGILGGVALLWVQPLAMILGVVMLSAISYVTLSTRERPLAAINRHVNPVLGWGWVVATLMANLVWSLPQFSLGTAAIQQNLLPRFFSSGPMAGNWGNLVVCGAVLLVTITVVWLYDSGSKGVKFFEILLKIMVAIIVISFFGVVVKMSMAGVLNWDSILRGFLPDLSLLSSPAKTLTGLISAVDSKFQRFWTDTIVGQQRDVMITVIATAVGINMTFLLPYSMLKRGWDRDFRGLAIFDLSTGLLIPFILATSCVVIASYAQFHAKPAVGILETKGEVATVIQPSYESLDKYKKIASQRIKYEIGEAAFSKLTKADLEKRIEALPVADKRMAATLVKRDAFDLANSLKPLTGEVFAHYVFGIGVVGMAVSTIIILMLINGFVVCEMLGVEPTGWPYRLGALGPGIGMLAPFIWVGKAKFWLAVPTSVFGMTLLPIAYFTFFLVMNQKKVLGENMPRAGRRAVWNVLMLIAAGFAGFCSIWSIWSKTQWVGIGVVAVFIALAVVVHIVRSTRR